MKKIILIIFAIVLLTSCEKRIIGDRIPSETGFPSLIEYYYIPSSPIIKHKTNGKVYNLPYIIGDVDSYLIISCIDSARIYNFNEDDPSAMRRFENYAKYFSDTIFSTEHEIDVRDYASVMPLIAINVVTEKKYDAQHPAGSNINDILYLHTSRNYEKLIAQQYEQGIDRRIDSVSVIRPINMLNEVFYLHFSKQPECPGSYTFSITMTFGADPITGDTIELAPVVFDFEFKS